MATTLDSKKISTQLKSAESALRLVLLGIFAEHKVADRILSGFFRENHQLGSRDRGFISETVYALLRDWGLLRRMLPEEKREAIEQGRASLRRVDLAGLLFGAMFLEKVQPGAARLLAEELGLRWPEAGASADLTSRARVLSAAFGCEREFRLEELIPEWVPARLAKEVPLERLLDDLTRRPPMWIRCQNGNPDALSAELRANELDADPHLFLRNAIAIRNAKVNLFTLDAFRRGDFEVQDLASQCIGRVASPRKGQRWLDCCAGAGGKTLQLADEMHRTGTVVASDIRAYKLEDLRKRARRAGFSNIVTREWNGKPFTDKRKSSFDGVLVDAPCTCSGVWRRNPDGRWNLTEKAVEEAALLQLQVLFNACGAVRLGGALIYATCSMFEEENRRVVERFLLAHPEFELEMFVHPLTGEPVEEGMLQIRTFDGDCDAMFAARMRKIQDV